MILRPLLLTAVVAILASAPVHSEAQEMQQADARTIDWVAGACTPDAAFGFRFGDRAPEPGYRLLDDARQPFPRLTLSSTERSRRLFRVETVGMFRAAPGSTQSDRPAGQRLFEALDARIVELGLFTDRRRVVEDDGDIEITYSAPTARPDSRVVLEVTLMLGGAWVTCRDEALAEQNFREVFQ